MKENFEVWFICGCACIPVAWYKGNDFREAVAAVDEIKAIDKNALIDFVHNNKVIALYN